MQRLLFLFLLAVLSACTGPQVLNSLTPESGYEAASNLIYDDQRQLRLDIYTPQQEKLAPVVVAFFGSRWSEGDKAEFKFAAQGLAAQGFVVVVPNYRKYPQARFPAFVEDGAHAVKWVRENIARYGGRPEQIFVLGHSAGAHIAAMLALNEDFMKEAGGSRDWIKGMIGLAGPYDFLPLTDPDLREIFAPPEDFEKSQPVFYVDGQNPPLLLMHGEDDELIRVKNTRNLASAVAKAGGPVETIIYPKMSHQWIIATMSSRLRSQSDVLDNISDFIHRIVAGKQVGTIQGGVEGKALPAQAEAAQPAPQALPLPEPTPLIYDTTPAEAAPAPAEPAQPPAQ